jgi:hypothetical protein
MLEVPCEYMRTVPFRIAKHARVQYPFQFCICSVLDSSKKKTTVESYNFL